MNFDDDFEMDDSPNEYLTAIGASGDKKRNSVSVILCIGLKFLQSTNH